MRLMVESYARQLFSVFFLQKIMMWVYIFLYFAVQKTPTAARRHSLVPGFHTTCVKRNIKPNCVLFSILCLFNTIPKQLVIVFNPTVLPIYSNALFVETIANLV